MRFTFSFLRSMQHENIYMKLLLKPSELFIALMDPFDMEMCSREAKLIKLLKLKFNQN